MSDLEYPELDERQMELVNIFHDVAARFAKLITNYSALVEVAKLNDSTQLPSWIAGKVLEGHEAIGEHYKQAVKTDGIPYVEAASQTGTSGLKARQAIAEVGRQAILMRFFISAQNEGDLPMEAYLNPASKIGQDFVVKYLRGQISVPDPKIS